MLRDEPWHRYRHLFITAEELTLADPIRLCHLLPQGSGLSLSGGSATHRGLKSRGGPENRPKVTSCSRATLGCVVTPNADDLEAIRSLLKRHGLSVAVNHLEQADAAFARREFESANAQTRSFLEALFEGVAAIRLHRRLSGGEARKRLAEDGVLSERQARVVQRVVELVGERGSHAGTSGPDHAAAVRLLGLGVARIGLGLLPDLVRVEDVFASQLTPPRGDALPADRHVNTSCPTCGESQTLAEAEASRGDEGTIYVCKNGCQPIVIVGSAGDTAWEGRGYRLGEHVIRNASDLECVMPLTPGVPIIRIPRSPSALMRKRSNANIERRAVPESDSGG